VSSVGFLRQMPLPLTDTADHVCFFRHALALDERRVKFIPEYLLKSESSDSRAPKTASGDPKGQSKTEVKPKDNTLTEGEPSPSSPDSGVKVKEVWFAGTHSDM
jgi:hypothetical protein